MLETGIKGTQRVTVAKPNLADAMGSGDLPVFATPAMIALMEKTAATSVRDLVDAGCSTVGTLLNVRHLSATPEGMTVTCESELVEVDGKRLVFAVRAYDESGLIGEGTHERFIVGAEKFVKKAYAKRGE